MGIIRSVNNNKQAYKEKENKIMAALHITKENFEAETIAPLNRKQAPGINEVIEERFGNFDPDDANYPINSEKRHCFNECFKKHEPLDSKKRTKTKQNI